MSSIIIPVDRKTKLPKDTEDKGPTAAEVDVDVSVEQVSGVQYIQDHGSCRVSGDTGNPTVLADAGSEYAEAIFEDTEVDDSNAGARSWYKNPSSPIIMIPEKLMLATTPPFVSCATHILPPEIIDSIVDFSFDIQDLNDIKNLSLCNSTFLFSVRRHSKLFWALRLLSLSRAKDFLSFIKDFPRSELPSCMKSLTIHVESTAMTLSRQQVDDDIINTINRLLAPELFSNIKELTICVHGNATITLKGLGRFITSRNISKLVLSNLILPPDDYLDALMTVKELSLCDIQSYCEAAVGPSRQYNRDFPLEKLEVGQRFNWIEDIFLHEPNVTRRLENLKHIVLVDYCPGLQQEYIATLLAAVKYTLEHLEVSLSAICFKVPRGIAPLLGMSDPICPLKLPSLRTLSINLPHGLQGNATTYVFRLVHRFFVIYENIDVNIQLSVQNEILNINRGLWSGDRELTLTDIYEVLKGAFPGWMQAVTS
ncbi:hypothetical protein BDQ17DRAFT_1432552 [Cyathus striatus]|nr:hypothetical protein BDQ17DRAFT_1432552 [Cyathus striatus]